MDTLGRLGSQLIHLLPENTDNWLNDIVHPGGWAWFACSVVAAIWICSRFVVRPLSEQISQQSETEVQALKFLRIAVDELRLELKSLRDMSNSDDDLLIAVNEQPTPNSTIPSAVGGTANMLTAQAKVKPPPSSTARRLFRNTR